MSDPLSVLKVNTDEYEIVDASARANKQDVLVSGTNIKTINWQSVLGSGNITVGGGDRVTVQQTLASGTEIGGVTVNGTQTKLYAPTQQTPPSPSSNTPLMDGNADVGSSTDYARGDHVHPSDTSKQDVLVSGTNIKTVNNESLLGSGNINIPGGGEQVQADWTETDTSSKAYILNKPGDWVVESGVSEGWRYVKWDSGLLELVTSSGSTNSVALTTQMVSGVYSNSSWSNHSFPCPSYVRTLHGAWASVTSNGYTLCQVSGQSASAVNVRVFAPYAQTITMNVFIYARGTWK